MNDLIPYLICEVAPCSLNALLSNTTITSNFAYNISGGFFLYFYIVLLHLRSFYLVLLLFSVSFPKAVKDKTKELKFTNKTKKIFLQLHCLMTFIASIHLWLPPPPPKKIQYYAWSHTYILNSSGTAGCEKKVVQNFKAIPLLYWHNTNQRKEGYDKQSKPCRAWYPNHRTMSIFHIFPDVLSLLGLTASE